MGEVRRAYEVIIESDLISNMVGQSSREVFNKDVKIIRLLKSNIGFWKMFLNSLSF